MTSILPPVDMDRIKQWYAESRIRTDSPALFQEYTGIVSTQEATDMAMIPEDRVDIHHIAPPKKKADRSGRPGGSRAGYIVNSSRALTSLHEEIKVVGATLMSVRGVVDEMKNRSDAMWKLIGPIPHHASLVTVTDVRQIADSLKGDIHKEVEELLGGVEMRLQEVEEDLYGNA